MTDKAKQPQVTADGAVELEEAKLDNVAGGEVIAGEFKFGKFFDVYPLGDGTDIKRR